MRTPEPYAFSQQQLIERGAPVRDVVRESGAQIVQDTQHVDPLQMQQHAQNLAPLNLQLQQRLMLTDRPWSEMVTQQDAARAIIKDIRTFSHEAPVPHTLGNALISIREGCLTSVRDTQGQIHTNLKKEKYAEIAGKVAHFYDYQERRDSLLAQNQIDPQTPLPLFRGFSSIALGNLQVGDSFEDVLPSSASTSEHFSKNWQGDNKVLVKIPVTLGYPSLMLDFPPGYSVKGSDPKPIGFSGQFETVIGASSYRITGKSVEGDTTILEVVATPLTPQQVAQKVNAARDIAFPPQIQVQPQLSLAEEVQAFRDKPKMIGGKAVKLQAFSQHFPQVNWNNHLAELSVLSKHFGEDYAAMQQSPIFPTN